MPAPRTAFMSSPLSKRTKTKTSSIFPFYRSNLVRPRILKTLPRGSVRLFRPNLRAVAPDEFWLTGASLVFRYFCDRAARRPPAGRPSSTTASIPGIVSANMAPMGADDAVPRKRRERTLGQMLFKSASSAAAPGVPTSANRPGGRPEGRQIDAAGEWPRNWRFRNCMPGRRSGGSTRSAIESEAGECPRETLKEGAGTEWLVERQRLHDGRRAALPRLLGQNTSQPIASLAQPSRRDKIVEQHQTESPRLRRARPSGSSFARESEPARPGGLQRSRRLLPALLP